ncbi:unnamed protein product [Absidia cylindrospora]
MSSDQEQVQVRFVTKQQQYAVKDAAILVPANFKRYGLSEIINNLLGLGKLVTIEYMESMLPPTPLTLYQHDDWISAVQGYESFFLTGSYDNMVRLWNSSGECTNTLIGHTEAVKSVKFGPSTANSMMIFSAGLDHTALAWQVGDDNEELLYECQGHEAAIESLAVNATKSHFATASADATIKIWTTSVPSEDEATIKESAPKKKRRTEEKSRLTKAQSVTLNGHVGAVNAVDFDSVDGNVVYSGGWDHSIRSWDIEQQVNTTTKNCEKVVLDVAYSGDARLIATGHTDNLVRLWDPRSEDGVNVKLALRGHKGWVSSVSWAPNSPYSLCSGSYDGSIRIWDIRSKGPVYTLQEQDHPKVLAVDWCGERIISGGEDKKLGLFQAKAY